MSIQKYCDSCEFYMQYAADDWQCDNTNSPKYGCSIDSTVIACNYWEKGFFFNLQDSRPEEKWKLKKVLFEDIGYDPFHDVNVYACVCPDCGLHIFEFTDDDVDDKCDSDDPEVMFKSSMVHHGYIGRGNFCERCGRRLDWGEYHK